MVETQNRLLSRNGGNGQCDTSQWPVQLPVKRLTASSVKRIRCCETL